MDITFLLIHFFSFIFQLFSSKRGIRLPIQDNVCTTGKPNQWQRPVSRIIMKPAVALNFDLHKNTRFENKVK